MSINRNGAITGYYCPSGLCYGFVRAPEGTIATFRPANTRLSFYPRSIDGVGTITGRLGDSISGKGFVRATTGAIKTFSYDEKNTDPYSINDRREITGAYFYDYRVHGFLRAHSGTIVRLSPPGAINEIPQSINNVSQITGAYEDSNNVWHGFLRKP
jgi:hypothetical protein